MKGKKKKKDNPWTTTELQYLLDWHGKVTFKEIALALDRSYQSVRSCYNNYSIKKRREEDDMSELS